MTTTKPKTQKLTRSVIRGLLLIINDDEIFGGSHGYAWKDILGGPEDLCFLRARFEYNDCTNENFLDAQCAVKWVISMRERGRAT